MSLPCPSTPWMPQLAWFWCHMESLRDSGQGPPTSDSGLMPASRVQVLWWWQVPPLSSSFCVDVVWGGSAERLKGSDAALCWLVTQSGQEEEAEQGWREARLRATHSHLLPKAFLVSALKVVNPRTPLSPATTRMVGSPTVPNSPNLLDWCPRRLTQGHKAEGL